MLLLLQDLVVFPCFSSDHNVAAGNHRMAYHKVYHSLHMAEARMLAVGNLHMAGVHMLAPSILHMAVVRMLVPSILHIVEVHILVVGIHRMAVGSLRTAVVHSRHILVVGSLHMAVADIHILAVGILHMAVVHILAAGIHKHSCTLEHTRSYHTSGSSRNTVPQRSGS